MLHLTCPSNKVLRALIKLKKCIKSYNRWILLFCLFLPYFLGSQTEGRYVRYLGLVVGAMGDDGEGDKNDGESGGDTRPGGNTNATRHFSLCFWIPPTVTGAQTNDTNERSVLGFPSLSLSVPSLAFCIDVSLYLSFWISNNLTRFLLVEIRHRLHVKILYCPFWC